MSTRKSILMMTNTGHDYEKVGDKIRGDSYFGYTDGIHTVQVTYQNFTGGFGIQGTLALDPKEEDWFWIVLTDFCGNKGCHPYLTYPKDPLHPTGSNAQNNALHLNGDSGTEAFTFIGNFTYLRSVLTRCYIQPPIMPQSDGRYYLGQIDRVLISL